MIILGFVAIFELHYRHCRIWRRFLCNLWSPKLFLFIRSSPHFLEPKLVLLCNLWSLQLSLLVPISLVFSCYGDIRGSRKKWDFLVSLVRLAPTCIVRYLPLQPVDCPSLFCKHIKFACGPQPMLSLFSTELQQAILTEGLTISSLRSAVWELWNILDNVSIFFCMFFYLKLKNFFIAPKASAEGAFILNKMGYY